MRLVSTDNYRSGRRRVQERRLCDGDVVMTLVTPLGDLRNRLWGATRAELEHLRDNSDASVKALAESELRSRDAFRAAAERTKGSAR